MRRLNGAMAAVLVGLLVGTGSAAAGGGQETHGHVLAPVGAWHETCTDPYLRAVLQTAARVEVRFHYGFTVRSSTWGRRFTLTPDHPAADIDIRFRGRPDRSFRTRALGGESGRVPRGATRAEVCLSAGAPTIFTYRAG